MTEDLKKARMREIEAAAYEVLAEKGYDGTSMLAVAKAARASNQTMYRWYGDKNGLFRSMVAANTEQVRLQLAAFTEAGHAPVETLRALAPVLLAMLLGERPITLNRAAASDKTGSLGAEIAAGGRDVVVPLLRVLMQRGVAAGALRAPDAGDMGALFVHLLVGDKQIRRVIGVMPPPSEGEIAAHADVAMAQFLALCGTGSGA